MELPNDIIHTDHLVLRRFLFSDIKDMLKNWIADPEVQARYGEPVYSDENSVKDLLGKWLLQYRFAIIHKQSSENIGHVSFCRQYDDKNIAEIEYCVGKAYWGLGLTTEAVNAFIRYTFHHTNIVQLEAFHRIENPASGRILQKVGMTKVDNVLRFSDSSRAPDGDICYAITKEQCFALSNIRN